MGYNSLEIYQLAFNLAIQVHKASLKLPKFELYEQGSQIRRSSKSIKDNIAEGYGRRKYPGEFMKFIIYASASCEETTNHINTLITLYPLHTSYHELLLQYVKFQKILDKYYDYVAKGYKN